jgi:hypothetical protein
MKRLCLGIVVMLLILGTVVYARSPLLETDRRGQTVQGALFPAVAQKITIDNAASNGTAFTATVVRLTPTVACYIRFGPAATGYDATNDYHYMGAGTTEYFRTGGNTYLSVLKVSATGIIYISEME